MKVVPETSPAGEHRVSPKGISEIRRRHMPLARGGIKSTRARGGSHPFDVEPTRIPPGRIGSCEGGE